MAPTEITWRPDVAEVASYIRARTKIAGGGEAGTFTEGTKPTEEQAEGIIDQAVRRVASEIGASPCTDDLQADAKTCAAMYAAILIETSYYPETTSNAGSSAVRLEALWKPQMNTLAEAVSLLCGEGTGGEGGADQHPPAHATFDERRLIGPNGPVW